MPNAPPDSGEGLVNRCAAETLENPNGLGESAP